MISRAALDDALDRVVDPCSNALGEPIGIRAMGLAEVVDVDEATGGVSVTIRLTSPCCAYGPMMAEAARSELERVPGVVGAAVEIDHAASWTPDRIDDDTVARVAARRRRTIELTGVRPYDWTSPKVTTT